MEHKGVRLPAKCTSSDLTQSRVLFHGMLCGSIGKRGGTTAARSLLEFAEKLFVHSAGGFFLC